MGRRASEGNILSDSDRYLSEFNSINPVTQEDYNMKTGYRNNNYNSESGDFSKTARLSLDVERRESSSSLSGKYIETFMIIENCII